MPPGPLDTPPYGSTTPPWKLAKLGTVTYLSLHGIGRSAPPANPAALPRRRYAFFAFRRPFRRAFGLAFGRFGRRLIPMARFSASSFPARE